MNVYKNIFDRMENMKDQFTPIDQQIYQIFIEDPDFISQSTTTAIAERCGVSQSAVSRFCRKLGFHSFSDLKMAFARSLAVYEFPSKKLPKEDDSLAHYMNDLFIETEKTAATDSIKNLAKSICVADHIYLLGAGKSAVIAQYLSVLLLRLRLKTFYIPQGKDLEILHITTNKDLAIVFSAKNPTYKDFLESALELPEREIPRTCMISTSAVHPLRNRVDSFAILPTWISQNYSTYVDTGISYFYFCSLLSNMVSKELNEDWQGEEMQWS